MSDESPRPSARRILVRGVGVPRIQARLRTYEELDRPGEDRFDVALRGPSDDGWVQLDVDPGLPLYHFHNLAMWMVGLPDEDELPSAVIAQSRGPLAVDYWLVPRDNGSVLHGRRSDGSAYAYDLAGGRVRTEPELQSMPQSARLALSNRGVPLGLVDDWERLPVSARDTLTPWLLDKPGTLLGRVFKGLFGG